MKINNSNFNLPNFEVSLLILVILTLFFFSDDGILFYGSIPTYLILLGLIFTVFCRPQYLFIAKFEQFFLVFLTCICLSILFAFDTVKISHIQSFLMMFLAYFYGRSVSQNLCSFKYLLWIFSLFLLLNFSIMALQLVTGSPKFYPGNPSYLIPTGIYTDQHKNAFSILMAYAFIQSYLIGINKKLLSIIFLFLCLIFILIGSSRAGLLVLFIITFYIYLQKFLIMILKYCSFIELSINSFDSVFLR
jgi:hypothetical protein